MSMCPHFVIAVNKQLADKERVAAALENTHLLEVRTVPHPNRF